MNLAELAARHAQVEVGLSAEVLAQAADLTLMIHQRAAREAGAILPAHMLRSYAERRETERDGMRSAIRHVLVALVLLEIVELPGRSE